jgi:hypothetical protein
MVGFGRRFGMALIAGALLVAWVGMVPVQAQESGGLTETFDDPRAPGWTLEGEAVVVEQGVLIMAGAGRASYEAEWSNFALMVRMQRLAQGDVVIHYRTLGDDPHYAVVLGANSIAVQRSDGIVLTDVGRVSPVSLPLQTWFDLEITVRGLTHTVRVDGEEVLQAVDDDPLMEALLPGGLRFEVRDTAQIEIDEVTVEVPSPGGRLGSTIRADLAVTGIYADLTPQGKIYTRLTNYGPDTLSEDLMVYCAIDSSDRLNGPQGVLHRTPIVTETTIKPGETKDIDIAYAVDTSIFAYYVICAIAPEFDDPDLTNNYLIGSVGGADLELTDIFICEDQITVAITNLGPESLFDSAIDLACTATATYDCGNVAGCTAELESEVTSAVGAHLAGKVSLHEVGMTADFQQYRSYEITCTVGHHFDPNETNNTRTVAVGRADCLRYPF